MNPVSYQDAPAIDPSVSVVMRSVMVMMAMRVGDEMVQGLHQGGSEEHGAGDERERVTLVQRFLQKPICDKNEDTAREARKVFQVPAHESAQEPCAEDNAGY